MHVLQFGNQGVGWCPPQSHHQAACPVPTWTWCGAPVAPRSEHPPPLRCVDLTKGKSEPRDDLGVKTGGSLQCVSCVTYT